MPAPQPSGAEDRPWTSGNAQREGASTGGWFVGHFLAPSTIAATDEIELKWLTHPAGQRREGWVTEEQRTTVAILVSGRFRIDLPAESVLLAEPGDYVMWGPGVSHSWKAEAEATMITIRWPSRTPD
jgi:quercetin dioxygenase-like cupin family protein